MNTLDRFRDSERTALICGSDTLSYRQMLTEAKQIARGLAAAGVRKGDRVLFCMRSSADAILGLLGILYAGGAYVAADPDWPEERLRFAAGDAKTVYSMTDETVRILRENKHPAAELPDVNGKDEAAVYYTSGSTGQPKGAVLHHIVLGTLLGSLFASVLLDDPAYEHWETFLSIYRIHFVPMLSSIVITFCRGKTLILPTEAESRSIDLLASAVRRHRPDVLAGTPSVALRYLENPSFAGSFSGFMYFALGGEKVTPSVLSRLSAAAKGAIVIPYGSSEMLTCAEYYYRNDGRIHLGTSGADIHLHPLDENMEDLSPGEQGELYVGGTAAAYGHYLNRPDLDAEKYVEHPRFGRLFRTGDMVRVEGDGEITIIGRMDGMVKLHGQRIEAAETENAMGSYPGIRRAAVRLLGEAPNEMLAGYYTVCGDVSETELRRYLADRLPYYMVPSLFMQLEQMPENAHGKLDYRALPLIAVPKREYVPPETEQERLLCELFNEVLGRREPVGVNDSFLALGGDSLSAMVAVSRLRKRGFSFEVRWLFTAPTARQLAPLLVPMPEPEGRTEDVPLTLTSGQRESVEKNIGWKNVECCYPVTRAVGEKLDDRDPYYTFGLFEIAASAMTPDSLRQRAAEMTQKHFSLRSVFLCRDGEEHLQVVLREHQPDCFSVDLSALSAGDGLSPRQKAYFRSLIRLDMSRPKDLEKDVLFRVGLVRVSEKRSMLYLAVSHLLLDGIGMERILHELMDRKIEISPDRELWQRHFARLYHSDAAAPSAYWQKLLHGCDGFSFLPAKSAAGGPAAPEFLYAAGGKRLYEQITDYCVSRHTTFAALMHYAFGRMLMERLSADDVCFLSVGSGRTAEDAELPGMFYVCFPVRLRRGDSLADCQTQLLSSAAHMSEWEAAEPLFTAGWKKCHATLDIVNFFSDPEGIGRRVEPFELSDTPDQHRTFMEHFLPSNREDLGWRFMIETDDRLGFFCAGAYNANRYEAERMKKLSQDFIRQLRRIITEGP